MTKVIAGVDEAGRGPLAGEVFAAAVVLMPEETITGLDDSKKLSEKKRIILETEIKARSLSWSVAVASVEEIDRLNILHASMLAMARALQQLSVTPDLALIDGNRSPESDIPCRAVVKGDQLHAEISAASILAKQARDRYMLSLAERFPQYGFERHKGYPTKLHLEALKTHGVSPVHRTSYAPVKAVLERH